eukprot:CAMPEP_0194030652 /NCGR_PEP_ID=MMETSP0009_2-20130614/4045_1 /TAXON_ID=210454 /ORGANISM="Grammatophora oceanica, Strain CCMP 410" /LENGTH=663 /DNA_ID=CAMNT_0038670631 /DNA_START=151 /DNA_END=2145 /DNA_ORIENTATION=+
MATSYHNLYAGPTNPIRRRTGSLGSLEGVDPNNLPEHRNRRSAFGGGNSTDGGTGGSLANFFSQQPEKPTQALPEDMQSCTSSVAFQRRWELEEQRKMLESKLKKLDRRHDRHKTKLKLQPGHTLDEVTATTMTESSASSSHHSGEGGHSSGPNGVCVACRTKDKMVQKQMKELQQLRLENMKLRGIPLQVMKLVDDDDSTDSGSGITNHVIATTPEEQYNLAVLNGEEKARQQEGESVKVENIRYEMAYPMPGNLDTTEGRRRGTYTGPVHSLSPHLPHGKGGKLVFLDEDGLEDDIYEGDFRDGEMHGEGKYTWAESGNVYKGSFWHNLRHGTGNYTNEKYVYEGMFQYDKPHGQGKQTSLKDVTDVIYDGPWEHGKKKKKEKRKSSKSGGDSGEGGNTSDWGNPSLHSRRSKKSSSASRSKSPTRGKSKSRHRRKSLDHTISTDGEGVGRSDDDGTVNTRRSSRKEHKSSRSRRKSEGTPSSSSNNNDLSRSTHSKSKSSSKSSRKGSSSSKTASSESRRHSTKTADGEDDYDHRRFSTAKSVDAAFSNAYSLDERDEELEEEEMDDQVSPMGDTSPNRARLLRRKESVRSMGNSKPVESRRDLMAQGFTDDEEDLEGEDGVDDRKRAPSTTPTTTLTMDDDLFATMEMNNDDLFNPFQS